jgi:hypothetical protein
VRRNRTLGTTRIAMDGEGSAGLLKARVGARQVAFQLVGVSPGQRTRRLAGAAHAAGSHEHLIAERARIVVRAETGVSRLDRGRRLRSGRMALSYMAAVLQVCAGQQAHMIPLVRFSA